MSANADGAGRDADDIAADVYDFVADFLDDQGSGNVRRIGDYLRRYPQAEEEVALEYLRLVGRASSDGVTQVGELADGGGEVPSDDGERRVGRYRLERLLGRGGQGEVWLAEDEQLQRRVALKLLTATFVTEERRGRFRREAESIARLEHPGLAAVHDADIDGDPPHIAMRFVQGVDLGASFGQREAYRASGVGVDALLPWVPARRADLAPVLRFFERAARALHAAHTAGVLHRDVKPGNIMVTGEGEPVLLDFGLAREEEAEGGSELTREGDVFGTLAYMAPEQLRGDLGSLDGRVDVWALGVTLYEALTGRRPFEGASPGELAVAIERSRAPDARSLNPVLPQDVRVVLETALEPDPERRYPTALALAEDLRRICEFEPIQARPAGPVLRLRRWARREPAWAAALAVTFVALVGGLIASQTALKRITTLLDLANGRLALANAREYTLKVPALREKAPAAALALGLEAVELEDSWTTRSSLFGPLMELTLQGQIHLPQARAWGVGFDVDDVVFGCGNSGGLQRADLRIAHDDAARSRSTTLDADVRALAMDRVRGAVVVGTTVGRLSAHDRDSLTELWSVDLGDGAVLDLHTGATHGAALLRPRSEPGSASVRDLILSFDLATGEVHSTLEAPEGGIDALRGGDGEALFVATGRAFHGSPQTLSKEAVVLELPDLGEVVRIAHEAPLRAAEIAADAGLVATLDAEGSVQVTSLETGFPVRMTGGGGPVESGGASLAFSRDGTRLALGLDVVGRDAHLVDALRVWTLDAGAGARTLDARETWTWPGGGRVVDLAFSPDGEKLAVASRNGVYVFDGATGSTLAEHRENNKPLHLEWSPSGKYLASIGIARTIEVVAHRADGACLSLRAAWAGRRGPVAARDGLGEFHFGWRARRPPR